MRSLVYAIGRHEDILAVLASMVLVVEESQLAVPPVAGWGAVAQQDEPEVVHLTF